MFSVWRQCHGNISEAILTESGEARRDPCSEAVTSEGSAHSVYLLCNALALKLGQYRFALDSNMLLVGVLYMET